MIASYCLSFWTRYGDTGNGDGFQCFDFSYRLRHVAASKSSERSPPRSRT
jgi:hypothetical protein